MRLTKAIRKEILTNVLREVADARLPKIIEVLDALALRAVNASVPDREYMAQLEKEYPGLLHKTNKVRCNYVIETKDVPFYSFHIGRAHNALEEETKRISVLIGSYNFRWMELFSKVSVPCSFKRMNENPYTDDKFKTEYFAILKLFTAVEDDMKALFKSISQIVDSITTDVKLIEIWPEAIKYIPKVKVIPKSQLPAINVNHVNKKIECAVKGNCK